MSTERATLTLTVSHPSSSSEELRISVPMEVITELYSKQTPEAQSSHEECLSPLQLSGILSQISLSWESQVRSLSSATIVSLASQYMDQPGVDCGLAEAIVHVMKNACVSMLLEVIHDEQEQLSGS